MLLCTARAGSYNHGPQAGSRPLEGAATTSSLALLMLALGCRPASSDTEPADTAQAPAEDAGDTLEAAQPIDDAQDMRIEPAGDRDFYWFLAEEGVTYDVNVRTAPDVGAFDPVLRVYDADGQRIAESDSLPYGLRNRSPAVLVRGEGARVYVEVLDRGDWIGQSPFGSENARYDVSAPVVDRLEPNEDTNADNDTVEQSEANAVVGDFDWYLDPWLAAMHFVVGDSAAPGDVDHLSVAFQSWQLPAVWQVSAIPGVVSAYDMRLSLVDGAGQVLASTTDPGWREPALTVDDAGISFPIREPGRYFVRVEDTSGASGPRAWYALLGTAIPFGQAQWHDLSAPETADEAVVVALRGESDGDRPSHYGTLYGALEDFGGVPDPFDTFLVERESGAVEGATLSAHLETASAGSSLDARLVVLLADGTVLAASDQDPSGDYADEPGVFDVVLPTDGPIRIRIEPQNGATGPGAFYLGAVRIVSPG